VSVSDILGEVGTMESEYIMESDKSREQEMYDIKQSLEQLSDAAMSTGMNYVDTLRRFQQMKNEETGVKQC
jgi:predicted aldo/keto reductase-like oxidoreductase